MIQMINSFDIKILNYIHQFTQNAVLDKIMPMITFLGNGGFIWILISAFLLSNKKYRIIGVMTLCTLILSSVLGDNIIKNIIQRPRPCADIPDYKLLIAKPLTYSFPSGHTASSFAAAGLLSGEFKKYRIYFILLASLIAFSRMYLYVHYPTDILGGIILGLICSKIVVYLFKRRTRKTV